MNKARRHELKMLKYKKRLKQLGIKEEPKANLHAFRSHGAPCSCYVCQQPEENYHRSKEKKKYKEEILQHNEEIQPAIDYFGSKNPWFIQLPI